jgi:hypothetical protein
VTNLTATVAFSSGSWTHVALTYSASGSQLLTNGVAAASGTGVSSWPDAAARTASGLKIGGQESNGASVVGRMDQLATFNYVQTLDEIEGDDSDGDGLTDAQERVLGTYPYDPDSNGTGPNDGVEYYSGQPLLLDVFTPLR